ncbi:MAG: class I SAM-dependent methyltransferase [Firmicutes bacterium]|nr:class I SAM-dependent methyltransferase [Bacillota bacterium]
MKVASGWVDYQIVATGAGEKLEKWGDVYLLRPDPQAIWTAAFDFSGFRMLHAKYTRSVAGGGSWEYFKSIPDEWIVNYKQLKFIISPTNFKHTGLFPEQAVNWERVGNVIDSAIKKRQKNKKNSEEQDIRVLNLFGYTGGATVACAFAGAYVTHVDASKGMTEVCKRNVELNEIPGDRVRYIIDDCAKFVAREIRRGKRYDAIIMDPPSFGRGANGEVWKIERDLDGLVKLCSEVLSDNPVFFLINSYTTGLQPTVMKNVLQKNLEALGKSYSNIDAYEIGLETHEGIVLPAGCSTFAEFK